jgi:1-acyl-sn-glycerol-3-phosphate acyltransferase
MARRAFLSPIRNPLIIWLFRLCFPWMKRRFFGGLTVHIDPQDLETLRQYQGKRMLLLPNHPTGDEPAVIFDVGMRFNEVFAFVAAREVFDLEWGFRGWVLRRMGTYSVIRGSADRESFLTTKNILMEGKHRLVIFIEGEISRENDTLIPFEPGVLQLAYWAQEALAKEAKKTGLEDFPPIFTAPIAIKYFYQPGIETEIERSLQGLEKAMGLSPTPHSGHYERLRAIGEAVLKIQEDIHQMISLPGTTLTQRIEAVKNRMLKKMELFLDLKPEPGLSLIERMREIRNTMDRLIHTYDEPTTWTAYQKRMVEHFRLSLREFYQDLERVSCFLTYDEAYLRENQSPERLAEMLMRLEREVFGKSRLKHPRVAIVKLGKIVNLKEHFPTYEADRKGFIQRLAHQMENDMMHLLATIHKPSQL